MENKRIVFLDYLRAIAIFMVIIVHCCEPFYVKDGQAFIASENDRLIVTIIDSLCRACVPLFVITSGYLLLPLRTDTFSFLKRRFIRVVIPCLLWSFICMVLPVAWGEFSWEWSQELLRQWLTNFPQTNTGHFWFIYMLIGVYLFMPILSAWLKNASRREIEFFLGLWCLTTFWYYIKELSPTGYLYGEAVWNDFHILYYNAGYIGFLLMAYYIRNYISWSLKKTLLICIPMFLLGFFATAYPFYKATLSTSDMYYWELPWRFTTPNVVLMTFALFMLIKQINISKGAIYRYIYNLSYYSYGMYLSHILILGISYQLVSPYLSTLPTILVVGTITYIGSFILIRLLAFLPHSKYLIG